MANQRNTSVATDKSNKKESSFLNYSSGIVSSRKTHSKENTINDELIMSLSHAYENERARQVMEWERRQTARLAV